VQEPRLGRFLGSREFSQVGDSRSGSYIFQQLGRSSPVPPLPVAKEFSVEVQVSPFGHQEVKSAVVDSPLGRKLHQESRFGLHNQGPAGTIIHGLVGNEPSPAGPHGPEPTASVVDITPHISHINDEKPLHESAHVAVHGTVAPVVHSHVHESLDSHVSHLAEPGGFAEGPSTARGQLLSFGDNVIRAEGPLVHHHGDGRYFEQYIVMLLNNIYNNNNNNKNTSIYINFLLFL
jgi:hypothetical protein